MRAQIPVITGFERLISEGVNASVPSRLTPDHASRGRPALTHVLQFPLSELHELASEEPAHAGGHIEVFGLGYDDEVLTLAECFDCLGLGHQVSSGLGEMRQPLRDDRPELLLLPAHGFILPYVLYPVDATRRRISRTMPPSRSGRSAGCPPRPGSR